VIAWPNGSVPEIVEHGVSGMIVGSVDAAVAAVHEIGRLDRARVRARCEERFSAPRMARDYLAVYRRMGHERRLREVSA
jgi:glycosyltransferase involved in cell wall biosynthesis